MKDKQALFSELDIKFSELKKDLNIKYSLDDFDKIFSIRNLILKDGFVSDNFSSQLRSKIVEYFNSGASYLHGLLLPNPQNIVNLNESKIVTQDEKNKLGKLIGKCMYLSAKNTLINLDNNKSAEKEFFEEAFKFYNEEFAPEMKILMEKVSDYWSK